MARRRFVERAPAEGTVQPVTEALTRRQLLTGGGALAVLIGAAPRLATGAEPPARRPLEGIGVGIDPGHNGLNAKDPG